MMFLKKFLMASLLTDLHIWRIASNAHVCEFMVYNDVQKEVSFTEINFLCADNKEIFSFPLR